MRRVLKLIPVVLAVAACAKKETPAVDTTQTAEAVAPAPAPALTQADVEGTWKGTSNPMGSDSVISTWTTVCKAGTCEGTSVESKVKVHYTYTVAADSSVGVSKPYSTPSVKGQVIDTWVARISGDNVTGTGVMTLASNRDSVVSRYRFAGSRVR